MNNIRDAADLRQQRVDKIISAQRLIKREQYKMWDVKAYWGQIPNDEDGDVKRLGFCGYAITDNVVDSGQPDLSSNSGTQVVIGPKSVIIWSAPTEEALDLKIKKTFKNFKWRNK
jgi:hypothetical protein